MGDHAIPFELYATNDMISVGNNIKNSCISLCACVRVCVLSEKLINVYTFTFVTVCEKSFIEKGFTVVMVYVNSQKF